MNENSNAGIDNLLSLFSDALTPADVLSAKLNLNANLNISNSNVEVLGEEL